MAENRTVALAAIVVTGVVGVTGPLITWKATRDTGQLSRRTQLALADRADLRTVLDEAGLVLRERRFEVDTLIAQWTRSGRPVPSEHAGRFDARLQRMGAISERLNIRLGERAPLCVAYGGALADLRYIGDRLYLAPADTEETVREREQRLTANSRTFFKSANQLAGSILK